MSSEGTNANPTHSPSPSRADTDDDEEGQFVISNLDNFYSYISEFKNEGEAASQSDSDSDSGSGTVRLILASQSPRRMEILDRMGLKGRYRQEPSPLNEEDIQKDLRRYVNSKDANVRPLLSPQEYTLTLAEEKAKAYAMKLVSEGGKQHPKGDSPSSSKEEESKSCSIYLILGSDTIVDLNGEILEKPGTSDEAESMLRRLSGECHQVHTGVALFAAFIFAVEENKAKGREGGGADEKSSGRPSSSHHLLLESFVDTARVKFAALPSRDIQAYVESNEPMDKAGAYGIQGMGGQFVESFKGDFSTAEGLPMHRTSRALSRAIIRVLRQQSAFSSKEG